MAAKITFRVGSKGDSCPEPDHYPVYDSNGWCRGLALTKKTANQIKRELTAGKLVSPILFPERRDY